MAVIGIKNSFFNIAVPRLLRPRVIYLLYFFSIIQVSAQTGLFTHLDAAARIGYIFPQAEISEYLDAGPVYGFSVTSPYYKGLSAIVELDYSLLDGENSPRSLHFIKSGAGLFYAPALNYIPSAGLCLDIYFIRSYRKKTENLMLMDDNESEFGLNPFINWKISATKKLFLQAQTSLDIIFSKPEHTSLLGIYIGVGRHLW